MNTLTEALDLFLMVDRNDKTNVQYRRILSRLIAVLGAARSIQEVEYTELLKWVAKIQSTVSPATLCTYVVIVKLFFTWAVKVQIIHASPAAALHVRKPSKDLTENRAMPLEILQEMLRRAYSNERDYSILMFMASTGSRVSSVARLKLEHLNLADKSAVLWKKGNKYYTVFFDDDTVAALQRWLAVRPHVLHDFVFNSTHDRKAALSVWGISEMVRKWSVKAGGRGSQGYGPHSIRHAVGHAYAQAGVPVTVIASKLGHADPRMTMDFYMPRDDSAVREASGRVSLTKGEAKSPAPPPAAPSAANAAQEQKPAPEPEAGKIIYVDWRSAG